MTETVCAESPVVRAISDFDGVLIDSEVISARMLIAALAERGITIDMGHVRRNFLGRSYPTVLEQIRRDFAVDLPPSFEADYRARLLEAFRRDLRLSAGVETLLDRLAVPSCVATSSSPARVSLSLDLVGLADRFAGRIFTASQVSRGKPAPDLFLLAAREMGVRPERALVVEDSASGLRAARAAGMQLCHYTGGSHLAGAPAEAPADAPPDLVLAHFSAFFDHYPALETQGKAMADER